MQRLIWAISPLLALAACGAAGQRPIAAALDSRDFGAATVGNTRLQTGRDSATVHLQQRFATEVPSTIGFDYDSAALTPEARAVLDRQAAWISQFPELRFRVYGHTDLVGSSAYNKRLGQRRAEAVVAYFASRGISPKRLEALVSYGETRPVVPSPGPEAKNRRTVTEVSGFFEPRPGLLDGKYAEIAFRSYIAAADSASTLTEVVMPGSSSSSGAMGGSGSAQGEAGGGTASSSTGGSGGSAASSSSGGQSNATP